MTFRKIILANFKKRLHNSDFTIISQNCVGGVIYHDLNLPFLSPTINMFIEDENFVKLVENLEEYMHIQPKPLLDDYVEPLNPLIHYPKITVGDIEICCLHYKNCEDAIEQWEKRKVRINYNNVFVIGNSWNMHDNIELIKRLVCNKKYRTVVFTTENMEYDNCLQLSGDFWKKDERGIVRPNLTDFVPLSPYRQYEKFFDYVGFLNGDSFLRNTK